ncbi:TfuA-like protein [uncultured Alsobacter sp.]|uniref:TfuA-like protein n=1 Tax=uncultured Alsobacter sp. TaxID=1748258 RepID=UPI0025E82E7B|nr:TfuA-like protein [uncultured Alsobacter sp.]
MASDVVVFLGPSLPLDEARSILAADYRPPAATGDVARAVLDGPPRAILLIDGVFARRPAVRHKEILFALATGVKVYGAASMGALRAAELEACGMVGIGFCFRWYRATTLADDDEVAVAMAPQELGSAALSDALIDVRASLARARRAGVLDPQVCRDLVSVARALPFVDRTYDRILDEARHRLARADIDRLAAWLATGAVSRKSDDARAALRLLATGGAPAPLCPPPPFRLTEAWAADLDAAGLWDAMRDRGLQLISAQTPA